MRRLCAFEALLHSIASSWEYSSIHTQSAASDSPSRARCWDNASGASGLTVADGCNSLSDVIHSQGQGTSETRYLTRPRNGHHWILEHGQTSVDSSIASFRHSTLGRLMRVGAGKGLLGSVQRRRWVMDAADATWHHLSGIQPEIFRPFKDIPVGRLLCVRFPLRDIRLLPIRPRAYVEADFQSVSSHRPVIKASSTRLDVRIRLPVAHPACSSRTPRR